MGIKIGAPPLQVILFFRAVDEDAGWSESFWIDEQDYSNAMDQVTDDQTGLVKQRLALSPNNILCEYVRISDTTKQRDTEVRALTGTDAQGTYQPSNQATTLPSEDAVQIRLQGLINEAPVFVLKTLRGISADIIVKGKFVPQSSWTDAFNTFKSGLISNYKIVVKSQGQPTACTIEEVVAQRASHRKTGRIFGQPVGRSRGV